MLRKKVKYKFQLPVKLYQLQLWSEFYIHRHESHHGHKCHDNIGLSVDESELRIQDLDIMYNIILL